MADAYILREMVAAEQAEFVALLQALTPDQWATPSLCQGWSVHDVVIHIAWHAHTSGPQRVGQLARAGFSVTRQLERDRARPKDELVDWLGSPARLAGPVDIRTQLGELMVHQQDVRRPLGIVRQIPTERLSVLLDFCLTRVGSASLALSRRRAKGLRLIAPDIGWSAGIGPEVRGPGEAIFMTINGRGNALQDLSGDGAEVLASRVPR